MNEVFLGDYIRQKRIELGLSQQELCEGICDHGTLSRLENGRQTPSRNRIAALLQRLGLPDDRYFALLSREEEKIAALQEEILSCNVRGEQEQGLRLLTELAKLADPDDQATQQFILRSEVLLGDYGFEEQLEMLMRAIRMTVPQFELDKLEQFVYCFDEVKVINQIACAYSKAGQRKKAIGLYDRLLRYVQARNLQIMRSGGLVPLIAHNYARELGLDKRYDDAIEIAEQGKQACIKSGHYLLLPGLLHIEAECYHYLGNNEKSKNLYLQAYYIYLAVDNKKDLAILLSDAGEQLGINLEL